MKKKFLTLCALSAGALATAAFASSVAIDAAKHAADSGDLDKAIEIISAATRADKNDTDAQQLGMALLRARQSVKAELKQFETALAANDRLAAEAALQAAQKINPQYSLVREAAKQLQTSAAVSHGPLSIRLSVVERNNSTPQAWICEDEQRQQCSLTELQPDQFILDHPSTIAAIVEPPTANLRANWKMDPAVGITCELRPAGFEAQFQCHSKGEFPILLQVVDAAGEPVSEIRQVVRVDVDQDSVDNALSKKEAFETVLDAQQLLQDGRLDEALTKFQRAAALDPTNTNAAQLAERAAADKDLIYKQLSKVKGLLYKKDLSSLRRTDLDRAESALAAAERIAPKYPSIIENRAYLTKLQQIFDETQKANSRQVAADQTPYTPPPLPVPPPTYLPPEYPEDIPPPEPEYPPPSSRDYTLDEPAYPFPEPIYVSPDPGYRHAEPMYVPRETTIILNAGSRDGRHGNRNDGNRNEVSQGAFSSGSRIPRSGGRNNGTHSGTDVPTSSSVVTTGLTPTGSRAPVDGTPTSAGAHTSTRHGSASSAASGTTAVPTSGSLNGLTSGSRTGTTNTPIRGPQNNSVGGTSGTQSVQQGGTVPPTQGNSHGTRPGSRSDGKRNDTPGTHAPVQGTSAGTVSALKPALPPTTNPQSAAPGGKVRTGSVSPATSETTTAPTKPTPPPIPPKSGRGNTLGGLPTGKTTASQTITDPASGRNSAHDTRGQHPGSAAGARRNIGLTTQPAPTQPSTAPPVSPTLPSPPTAVRSVVPSPATITRNPTVPPLPPPTSKPVASPTSPAATKPPFPPPAVVRPVAPSPASVKPPAPPAVPVKSVAPPPVARPAAPPAAIKPPLPPAPAAPKPLAPKPSANCPPGNKLPTCPNHS